MNEPRWLTRTVVDTIHSELIAEHGGAYGVREGGEDLIESALARPRNRFLYAPDSDLSALAASYLFGFVKNHGYIDGNKRVGFACAIVFLVLNGVRLTAPEAEAYNTVMQLADGSATEEDIAGWLRRNTKPLH